MKTLSARGRFWKWVLIDESERCWKWLGQYNEKGYGRLEIRGLPRRAHRAAWELCRGEIPKGLYVLHHCDNPPCVNPRHLWLGTQVDNWADALRKGRTRIGGAGELNPKNKLKRAQVLEIRATFKLGQAKEVAEKYGISPMHAHNLLRGRFWECLKES